MSAPATIRGRYEIREILGQGGMGVVYAAYDRVVRRLVAVKTIRDIPDPLALELFQREGQVLADLSHPNIVEMFDIGEFADDGFTKPYFVMPLLRGATLDQLMRAHDGSLPPSRSIDIISQACRGLFAAHESGLVHRDLKPSNIFVLDDDSVKIIDFGVAHLLTTGTTFGAKGTPHYIAPEQIEEGGASPLSDQFSMAVVAYELLAGKLPFPGTSAREIARSILNTVPAPVFEANPAISLAVSQVIAKALAKKPSHRFGTIKEFSDALQRAFLQNKSLTVFDEKLLLPRIERAERALAAGDITFAEEITAELEDEGSLHAGVGGLRRKIEAEKRRSRVDRLLTEARHRLGELEYSLALEKVTEALRLDETNHAAQELRAEIENRRDERRIEQWLEFARRSREAHDYERAQENLTRVLQLRPAHADAKRLAAELKIEEADYRNRCEERDRLYRSALHAWREGDLAIALERLERALQLDGDNGSAELKESHAKLKQEVEKLNSAVAEIRDLLAQGQAGEALAACRGWLQKYPSQPLLEALRLSALDQRRKQSARYLADVEARATAENDLDRRVELLEEAEARYPDEQQFHQALSSAREHRDLVRRLERRAADFEKAHEWNGALEQWKLIGGIHPAHPGLAENIQRLQKRSEQHSEAEEKARWVRRIDRELEADRVSAALGLIAEARQRFPGDAELDELEKLAAQRSARRNKSEELLVRGDRLCEQGELQPGIAALKQAHAENPTDAALSSRIAQIFLREAQRRVDPDPDAAEQLAREAAALDPNTAGLREVERKVADHKREERVSAVLAQARRHQSEGNLPAALAAVQDGLSAYPGDPRLDSLLGTLNRRFEQNRATYEREAENLEEAIRRSGTPTEEQQQRRLLLERLLGRPRAAAVKPESPRPNGKVPAIPVPPQPQAAPKPKTAKLFLWAGGVAAAAAVLSAGVLLLHQSSQRPSAVPQRAVALAPPPAKTVPAPPPVPSGPPLLVRVDSPDDTVSINGKPEEPLSANSLDLNTLPAGKQQLVISAAGGRRAFFDFDSATSRVLPPKVSGRGLLAVSAHIEPKTLTLLSSNPMLAASVDQGGWRRIGSGARFALRGSGPHLVTFAYGADNWSIPLAATPSDSYLAMAHALSGGSVLINAGVDDADVYIDGVKLRRKTRNGFLRVGNLPPHTYSLKVAKPGFEDRTGNFTITTGKEVAVNLPLSAQTPLPGSLQISSGTPGAEVSVDGQQVGQLDAAGALGPLKLAPGKHEIAFSKPKFTARSQSYTIGSGQRLQLENEAKLERSAEPPATLRFALTPAHATVSLKNAAGNVSRAHAGEALSLPAGSYEVSVSAPGFVSRNLTIDLASGETKELPVKLLPAVEERHPATDILAGWEDVGSWSRENGYAVRRGGGMAFYGRTNLTGTIHFDAELRKGKRLQWFVHFKGPENYCHFEADKQHLSRNAIVNGRSIDSARKEYTSGNGKDFSVEIIIRKGTIIHRINGQTVDTWTDPQVDFADGSFGFIVPGRSSGFPLIGNNEIALRSFSFSRAQSAGHLSENISGGR